MLDGVARLLLEDRFVYSGLPEGFPWYLIYLRRLDLGGESLPVKCS